MKSMSTTKELIVKKFRTEEIKHLKAKHINKDTYH